MGCRDNLRCANCRAPIKPGETEHISSLSGSKHVLCEDCGLEEEKQIDELGTNNIPSLLESYGAENDFDEREEESFG